ncbi:MAG: 3'-5' exonuclease [Halobacteria archaeon]
MVEAWGWVVDVYPDERQDKMVIWIKTSNENIKMVEEFYPAFYIHASRAELESLKKRYQVNNWIKEMEFCRAKLGFYSSGEVLKITVKRYKALNALAREIDTLGDYEYRFFNVDLSLTQRYFFEKNIFPMAYIKLNKKEPCFELLDSEYSRDYQIPDLKSIELRIEIAKKGRIPRYSDRLSKIYIDGGEEIVLESKDEAALLLELNKCIKTLDPDAIYTQHGDSFILPFLYHRGLENNIRINLGRELDSHPYTPSRGERSYFSYGRIMYKPASYLLQGRMHIDVENSFLYQESGLEGLILLSRLSRIPLQKLARASPGTAISSMQLLQAYREGILIEWKKSKPEKFKTAAKLLLSDRGGFIYEPRVGIFNDVAEIDFSSLYPNIMLHKNISPETVLCECCRELEVENVQEIVPACCQVSAQGATLGGCCWRLAGLRLWGGRCCASEGGHATSGQ